MAAKKTEEVIEIRPLSIQKVALKIVGDSPLIMHAWSEKAKKQILDKQLGKAKGKKRENKDPMEDFIDSMYWLTPKPTRPTQSAFDDAITAGAKFGFPATAVKQASTSAAYRLGFVNNQMGLRGAFFIDANRDGMIELHSDTPVMREDMVRIPGSADIRYRGEFRNWYADITISYNSNGEFNLENIINIINAGGYVCGIGEWRPERDGDFGRYHVETV